MIDACFIVVGLFGTIYGAVSVKQHINYLRMYNILEKQQQQIILLSRKMLKRDLGLSSK